MTKSKRVTNSAGATVSTIELDPWGANIPNRSINDAFQPRKFTSYERDSNGSDEAMFRRYNRWQSRFDQPDPYDGSYEPTNPQSFNRYAYVQNDPVNFVDPTGLMRYLCMATQYYGDGLWIFTCEPWCTFRAFEPKEGGGGTGGKAPQNSRTPYVDQNVLNDCTKKLFGVKTIEFVGSVKGKGGHFKGNGPLWESGGRDRDFTVHNNNTAMSTAELTAFHQAHSTADPHYAPPTPGYVTVGYTPPWGNTNYTANDLSRMDALKNQVHELGHSFQNLIGLKYPGDLAGRKLKDCVQEEGGFKYK